MQCGGNVWSVELTYIYASFVDIDAFSESQGSYKEKRECSFPCLNVIGIVFLHIVYF